ncbi:hypothetical protein LINGRAHAP2_LOCUS27010 [Linum grandiflorum]
MASHNRQPAVHPQQTPAIHKLIRPFPSLLIEQGRGIQ